jgi:hypothetical protein
MRGSNTASQNRALAARAPVSSQSSAQSKWAAINAAHEQGGHATTNSTTGVVTTTVPNQATGKQEVSQVISRTGRDITSQVQSTNQTRNVNVSLNAAPNVNPQLQTQQVKTLGSNNTFLNQLQKGGKETFLSNIKPYSQVPYEDINIQGGGTKRIYFYGGKPKAPVRDYKQELGTISGSLTTNKKAVLAAGVSVSRIGDVLAQTGGRNLNLLTFGKYGLSKSEYEQARAKTVLDFYNTQTFTGQYKENVKTTFGKPIITTSTEQVGNDFVTTTTTSTPQTTSTSYEPIFRTNTFGENLKYQWKQNQFVQFEKAVGVGQLIKGGVTAGGSLFPSITSRLSTPLVMVGVTGLYLGGGALQVYSGAKEMKSVGATKAEMYSYYTMAGITTAGTIGGYSGYKPNINLPKSWTSNKAVTSFDVGATKLIPDTNIRIGTQTNINLIISSSKERMVGIEDVGKLQRFKTKGTGGGEQYKVMNIFGKNIRISGKTFIRPVDVKIVGYSGVSQVSGDIMIILPNRFSKSGYLEIPTKSGDIIKMNFNAGDLGNINKVISNKNLFVSSTDYAIKIKGKPASAGRIVELSTPLGDKDFLTVSSGRGKLYGGKLFDISARGYTSKIYEEDKLSLFKSLDQVKVTSPTKKSFLFSDIKQGKLNQRALTGSVNIVRYLPNQQQGETFYGSSSSGIGTTIGTTGTRIQPVTTKSLNIALQKSVPKLSLKTFQTNIPFTPAITKTQTTTAAKTQQIFKPFTTTKTFQKKQNTFVETFATTKTIPVTTTKTFETFVPITKIIETQVTGTKQVQSTVTQTQGVSGFNTNQIITTQIIVPPPFIPKLPSPFSDRTSMKNIFGKRTTKYTPSYTAMVFNIKGKAPKGPESGLRIRPITKGFKWF